MVIPGRAASGKPPEAPHSGEQVSILVTPLVPQHALHQSEAPCETQCDAARIFPTLRRLAATFVLAHASDYDAESQEVLAEILSQVSPVVCGSLRSVAAFAGASSLPSLIDVMRVTLAQRSRAAGQILDDLTTGLSAWEPPSGASSWIDVEATCDRLLTVGLHKREIHGPTLPQQLANRVRRVRKIAQAQVRATHRATLGELSLWFFCLTYLHC